MKDLNPTKWSCCEQTLSSEFCPKCGSKRPQPTNAEQMLAEVSAIVRSSRNAADTISNKIKALENEKSLGIFETNLDSFFLGKIFQCSGYFDLNQLVKDEGEEWVAETFESGVEYEIKRMKAVSSGHVKRMLKYKVWESALIDLMGGEV